MKTNVELNSPKEEGIYESNQKQKDKDNIHKNEDNANINNIKNISINDNEEKNKEDKNKNNINEKNNNDVIIKNVNDYIENNHKQDNLNDIIQNIIVKEKKEEDPLITYIASNRKISEEEIKNASKLIIEEIDGTLLNGKIIEINAGGMVNGRNKKDGFTIFGQKRNIKAKNSNKKISFEKEINNNQNQNNNNDNDIFIPDIEINFSKYLGYPYIFAIYYKREDKSYYIRAYCGKGSDNRILFIKLNNENKYILKQKELISAGNIIFQVNAFDNNCLEIINLTNKKYSNYRRVFDGFNKKIVTIGRHKDCDYFFAKDKSFSRYQTTFDFDENKKEWSVIDGKDNKGSTNGTWIFGIHSFLIKNEMIVEILNSKIKIKEIKNVNLEDKK